MDDNGTYLGNIYGIYKECITNISIDIYDTGVCEKRYHLKKPVLESLDPPPLESMLQWIRDPR